uniref:Uncharacterized protein n=1 Tax=Romanomermis culicivorax TaxID=13658 RepID=A0A915KAL8_ROMCU
MGGGDFRSSSKLMGGASMNVYNETTLGAGEMLIRLLGKFMGLDGEDDTVSISKFTPLAYLYVEINA